MGKYRVFWNDEAIGSRRTGRSRRRHGRGDGPFRAHRGVREGEVSLSSVRRCPHPDETAHAIPEKVAAYYAARDALRLELRTEDGTVLAIDTIHIVDLSDEARGADAMELEVIFASRELFENVSKRGPAWTCARHSRRPRTAVGRC